MFFCHVCTCVMYLSKSMKIIIIIGLHTSFYMFLFQTFASFINCATLYCYSRQCQLCAYSHREVQQLHLLSYMTQGSWESHPVVKELQIQFGKKQAHPISQGFFLFLRFINFLGIQCSYCMNTYIPEKSIRSNYGWLRATIWF